MDPALRRQFDPVEEAVRALEVVVWSMHAFEADDALVYRTLATLRTDVPPEEGLDDLRFRGVPRDRFEAWCDAMDVRTLKARPTRWAP